MKKLKIWFSDWWHSDFKMDDNLFWKLLSDEYQLTLSKENPDLLFYSVFGNDYKEYSCKKVFFTGEGKPPYGDYDLALSFNYEEDDKHIRFPLYAYMGYEENSINRIKNKQPDSFGRQTFCVFMASNSKFVAPQFRNSVFVALNKYKPIISTGQYMRNKSYPEFEDVRFSYDWRKTKDKILEIERPKFMICIENGNYPGYTTEKIYDAMKNNIVPIYWGNSYIKRDFNTNSFINAHDYSNIDELVEAVKHYDNDSNAYNELHLQPWLNTTEHLKWFDLNRIKNGLYSIIEDKTIITPAVKREAVKQRKSKLKVEEYKNPDYSPKAINTLKEKPARLKLIGNPESNVINNKPQMGKGVIHPNDWFDEIFCINLTRRYDRWITLKDRFKREGLTVTRFEGVDGSTPIIQQDFKLMKSQVPHSSISTSGAYGILLAFLKLYKHIYFNTNHERVLIIEDDILFHNNFIRLFSDQHKQLPEDWDMWYLGCSQHISTWDKIRMVEGKPFYYPKFTDGMFAHGLRRKFIPKIIEMGEKRIAPIDTVIHQRLQQKRGNTVLVSWPYLCDHDYGFSDNWNQEMGQDVLHKGYYTKYNKGDYH